jgi:hypothetical protein
MSAQTCEGKLKAEWRAWIRAHGAYVFSPLQWRTGVFTVDDLVCFRGWFTALAMTFLLTGCLARGPTPEQLAVRDQNNELLDEARAGKIKWIDYARQSNANFTSVYPNANYPQTQEALSYRIVLAQRVDDKKLTPEEFDYEWKHYLADQNRQAMANAAMIMAATPPPVAYHPTTCITTGIITTCN